jgi:NEDD8-activating enzyme E1
MRRCPGVKVIPHKNRIQELPFSFYEQFNIIIGGLDNVEARKYLNNVAFNLNLNTPNETTCFYVDGAT